LVGGTLGGENDHAHHDACHQPSPGLVITEDADATPGAAAVDGAGEPLEAADHYDGRHVREVGRQEEVDDLVDGVREGHSAHDCETRAPA